MRAVLCIAVLALAVACASATRLPPGFNSANELASVLANEPDAAREARFASTRQMTGGDTVTFTDSDSSSGASSASSSDDPDTAEIDNQIDQIKNDMKKLKEAIKESEDCARRLAEQKAEVRSLQEQKEHLEKEKEKRKLQNKLEKQMKDMAEINRMSRALRTKFAELKHTQKLIKTKMTGTRSSLNQLDSDTEAMTQSDMSEAAADISAEVEALQKAQSSVLSRAQSRNTRAVKNTIDTANKLSRVGDSAADM